MAKLIPLPNSLFFSPPFSARLALLGYNRCGHDNRCYRVRNGIHTPSVPYVTPSTTAMPPSSPAFSVSLQTARRSIGKDGYEAPSSNTRGGCYYRHPHSIYARGDILNSSAVLAVAYPASQVSAMELSKNSSLNCPRSQPAIAPALALPAVVTAPELKQPVSRLEVAAFWPAIPPTAVALA